MDVEKWIKRRLKKEIVEQGTRNTSYIDALRINEEGEIVLVQAYGNATDVKKGRIFVREDGNVPEATKKRLAKDRTRVISG